MCTISFDVHIRLGLLMHIRLKGHISSWIFWARMCGVDGHQPPRLNVVTCSTNLCKLNRHHSEIAYIHGYEYCSGQCLFIFIYTVYLLLIICIYIDISISVVAWFFLIRPAVLQRPQMLFAFHCGGSMWKQCSLCHGCSVVETNPGQK